MNRFLDWFGYELRKRLEGRQPGNNTNLREKINQNPHLMFIGAAFCLVLLAGVLIHAFWPQSSGPDFSSKNAWYYHPEANELFTASKHKTGSDKTTLKAHVYSYSLVPDESDLFVGFLERPDAKHGHHHKLSSDMRDFHAWAHGREIKRPDDTVWVSANSPEGQAIIQSTIRPNGKGQVPIYQKAK